MASGRLVRAHTHVGLAALVGRITVTRLEIGIGGNQFREIEIEPRLLRLVPVGQPFGTRDEAIRQGFVAMHVEQEIDPGALHCLLHQ